MNVKCIYKITNLVNNKVYIGQSNRPRIRWYQHKKESQKDNPSMIINQAMKKYGVENFSFEVITSIIPILDENEYCKIADEFEEYFIQEYQSHISLGKGYNVSRGGSTSPKTEQWKQKLRNHWADPEYKANFVKKTTGQKRSEEVCQKISESRIGYKISEELKTHLSKTISNKYQTDPEYVEKHKLGQQQRTDKRFTGKKHTEESKRKMSENLKGNIPPNKGKRKLTSDQIQEVFELRESGSTLKTISERFNCCEATIFNILNKDY